MTVRKIIELIDQIKSIIGQNSFSQNLQDYIVTIQNNASNLVLLKEITDKAINDYKRLLDEQVPEILERVLVGRKKPFTETNYLNQLEDLKAKNNTEPEPHYNELNGILTSLQTEVLADITELDLIRAMQVPFLSKDYSALQKEDNAIFAIIFSNENSFNNLKTLSFELKNWDRGLFIYQQVISDETPKAFEIVEIDQGSIEVVLNLLYPVAEKLLELFKTGLEVYGAYLAYKTIVHDNLIKSYRGNDKLIKSEEEREKLLLENVRAAVRDEIKKQAKKAAKKEAIDKKIDVVTALITEHIIKGNSVKLLSAPVAQEVIKEKEAQKEEMFIKNKANYKKLDTTAKQLLLDEFTSKPTEDDYEKE